jgi:acetyl-CoA decarbonylase/synthase complex subunit gamma
MALTGLQIQKLLPATNCKECGSNTCLAFAMKLAAKKAEISGCPYASDEAKQVLGLANEPPVKTIAFGADKKLVAGGELVLYRHDKTFVNRTIIAVNINDTDAPEKIEHTLQAVKDYVLERVGESFGIGMVAVTQLSRDDKDSLVALAMKLRDGGLTNILLQAGTHSLPEQLQTNTIVRRAAIKDNFKPLGFPFLHFIDTGNLMDDTTAAVTEITKYGSICVLPGFDPAQLATLLALRLNIFTDPQKPIQVEPKVYPVGDPTPDSPVFVTTNFSLTFFIVSGEIENSGISAWLAVPECEGMSVLTAWAAGKFSASSIAKFIKEIDLEAQVKTRKLVIPGYVSQISGELEDSLPGWQVMVGPEEAGDLESFIKARIAV